MKLVEGYKFIRPDAEGLINLLAVPSSWVGWHHAEIKEDRVLVPAQMMTGQRVVIELPNSFITDDCGAPSVDEYLAKKKRDHPPTVDNTYE